MEEVSLVVMIEVIPGQRDTQLDLYRKLKPLVDAEPGCLQYTLFSDAADENRFVLLEKWATQSALDAHDVTEHMIAADALSTTFRTGPARVIKMTAITA